MKITPSHKGYTKGRYEIMINNNNPGAIELRESDGNVIARIYAVSPKLNGSRGGINTGPSANAYIMEKECKINGKALSFNSRQNLMYNQIINLIWNFCIENELEVSPIEFDLTGFVNMWFTE